MAASLALLALTGAGAFGQQVTPPAGPVAPAPQVLSFSKEADPNVLGEPLLQQAQPAFQYEKKALVPAQPAQTAPHRQMVPAAAPGNGTQLTFFQEPMGTYKAPGEASSDEYEKFIQLQPPGPHRLFRLESEDALKERIRQEHRQLFPSGMPSEISEFPVEKPVSTDPFTPRSFPPATEVVEPAYVCYGRLMFEQRNYERGGWDLGIINPGLSALTFFADAAILPYNLFKAPWRCYDCSAGYCLPGDPVPFLIYPPELSITGGLAQAGTTVLLFAIFP